MSLDVVSLVGWDVSDVECTRLGVIVVLRDSDDEPFAMVMDRDSSAQNSMAGVPGARGELSRPLIVATRYGGGQLITHLVIIIATSDIFCADSSSAVSSHLNPSPTVHSS